MAEQVMTELDQGVLIVRMNRPQKKNALTGAMYGAMADAIDRAQGDRSIRVVLFTGTAGDFTAGNDLNDFLHNPPDRPDSPVNRFIAGMAATDVPLMAAVDGLAVGIGTTMLLHFDYVLATGRARFILPFIDLGLVPEAGSSYLLARTCGHKKAAEALMLGEPFDADQALDCGIVSRLCGAQELMNEALAVARKLAVKPADALRATKRLMRRPPEPLAERIQAEGEAFFRCLASPVAREAMTAIMEKRKPDFSRFD
jgi:enoyl-CoA hydratase/carnithine racemase